jgi:membrane-bound lytic murein transglycosylase
MDQAYKDALQDWNMLISPTKHRLPRSDSERDGFKKLLDYYVDTYKGGGVAGDVADVAGTVADVSQFIPGANVVSGIARGINVIANTAERASKERALAEEQSNAYKANEALQKELYAIRQKYSAMAPQEEKRQERNLVLMMNNPSTWNQRSKFKAYKAEAIRQLQEEGKTPAEVARYYHERIAQIQANPEAQRKAWENRGDLLKAKERTVSPQEQAEIDQAKAKYSHRPLADINAEIQELNATPAPVSSLLGFDVGF